MFIHFCGSWLFTFKVVLIVSCWLQEAMSEAVVYLHLFIFKG